MEQHPQTVVESLRDAARAAIEALGPRAADIVAAGLATQRSSIVCWDRDTGEALSPVISWQDRRAHAWLGQFATQADVIEQRSGLRLSAHYGASKLRWCLENLEAVRVAHEQKRLAMGPLATYLAFQLLDNHPLVVDPSNAQRTLLWNLESRDWDAFLLDLFDVPRAVLPTCVSTRRQFGDLRIGEHTIPTTVVIGDQAAALFAFGAPAPEVAYINLGTGAFAQRTLPAPQHVDGLLTGIASQDENGQTYTLEGTVNGAGAALAWAAQALTLPDLEARLSEWLSRTSEPPLFLNGIGGLGAPYWIADLASQFIGEGELWQKAIAVAESIVFLLAENLNRMQGSGPLQSLVLTGGLAQCDGLCQRLADLTGLPAWRPQEHEATARGLAWLLAERPSSWPEIEGRSFLPVPNAKLSERYRRWRLALHRMLEQT